MNKLFGDFKAVSAAEWKTQLEKDLKGVPYEDLIWQHEGLRVKPYYMAEDLKTSYLPAFEHNDWRICVGTSARTDEQTNKDLLRALTGGANAIILNLSGRDLNIVLAEIRLDFISSTFIGPPSDLKTLAGYLNKNYQGKVLDITLIPENLNTEEQGKDYLEALKAFQNRKVRTASCDVTPFHNQYCDAAYEIALAFAQCSEYYALNENLISGSALTIHTGVNSDYFTQIAKFRAMRRLWMLLKKEFGVSQDLYIIAETSLINKTVSDKYNNLLRTTVESMAAVAGGCNELLVHDFEILSGPHTAMAQRMAVNQQLILKDESYLDKMADVSCGSYFIESLTDQLAEKALIYLKEIEKQGGYFVALASGLIDKEIKKQSQIHLAAFNDGKELSIGVNKFHNDKEKMSLTEKEVQHLKSLKILNPALRYELQHFFDLKNA